MVISGINLRFLVAVIIMSQYITISVATTECYTYPYVSVFPFDAKKNYDTISRCFLLLYDILK